MKKMINSKVLPFNINTIKRVIKQPSIYNIRDYEIYKQQDNDNWIEDYGFEYIVRFKIISETSNEIIIESSPVGNTQIVIKNIVYKMTKTEKNATELIIEEKFKQANIFRRITGFVDQYGEEGTYYMNQINKIEKFCVYEADDTK